MSTSATLDSTSTTAEVIETDVFPVGEQMVCYVRVRYIDPVARPDLAGKKSGWIRCYQTAAVGDILRVAFSPRPDRLGGMTWKPVI